MTLVVPETGSIVANADSYISEANADTFLSSRGDTMFHGLGVDQQGFLLRQATDYMLQSYRDRWRGWRVSDTQPLDWPRNGVVIPNGEASSYGSGFGYGDCSRGTVILNNVVPTEVQRACAMLALIANGGALAPDISRVVLERKFDVIETKFDPRSPPYKIYRSVSMLLSPFFRAASGGGFAQVVRT